MFSISHSPGRLPVGRTAFVGTLVAAVVAFLVLGLAPGRAAADDPAWTTVTDEASLQAALTAQDPGILLANDITVTADSLTNSFAAVVNLDGHTLTTKNFTMLTNGRLDLVSEDSGDNPVAGGTLVADASTLTGLAGISVNGGAQFYPRGVTVTATGGAGAAGIGGDTGQDSGSIQSSDATLTATGGSDGAGIGGGDGGDVSQMISLIDTAVTATAGSNSAAIGGGDGGSVKANIGIGYEDGPAQPVTLSAADASVIGGGVGGSIVSPNDYSIGAAMTLDAPNYLDVPNDGNYYDVAGTLSGTGSLTGSGNILNSGAISLPAANLGSVNIVENSYDVDFDAQAGGVPAHQYVEVYAPTFAAGDRGLPDVVPLTKGMVFTDWRQADGTTPFSTSDDLATEGAHYYAHYVNLTTLSIVQPADPIVAGTSADIQVTGTDAPGTDTADQSQFVTLTDSNPADIITGDSIAFAGAGPRTIGASVAPWDSGLSTSTTITVASGTLSNLTLSRTTSGTVYAGNTLGFTVEGSDAGGDDFGDQTSAATLSSNVLTDTVDNTAHTVTFNSAGTHIITATEGAATGTFNVAVVAAAPTTMEIAPVDPTVTAGVAQAFTVTGKNSSGVSLGDITSQVVWSGLSSSDVRTGNSIVFGAAGTRTLKATIGAHSVSTTVHVVAGRLARLAFVKPPTSAVAGATDTFTVTGYDSRNNSLGTETVTLTLVGGPQTGETIVGSKIKFTQAGSRTVTATKGLITQNSAVTVTPAAVHSLDLSSSPSSAVAGVKTTFSATAEDAYGNETGTVSASLTAKSSVSTDKFVKNAGTFTKAGPRTITFTDGTAHAVLPFTVDPAGVVAGKLAYASSVMTAYPNLPFSVQVDTSDQFGNPIDPIATAAYAASGSGNTVDDPDAQVTFTVLGKHTLTASYAGTHLSETITVIKDSAAVTFPTTSIIASIPSTIDVTTTPGPSGFTPTGLVTLHYGSHSLAVPVHVTPDSPGSPSAATFSLPALAVGSYVVYATYGGDVQYNAHTTSKTTVHVVPGPLDHLVFVKPPTTALAGATDAFSVLGYDIHNNLIGSETANAVFTLSDLDAANGESVAGAKIKFTDAGVRTITATVNGTVSMSTSVTVVHAAAAHLDVTPNSSGTAGVPTTFSATATDAYGNSLGDVSTLLVGSSTVSTDHFVKNVGTFTRAGTRALLLKDGSATDSFAFTVSPATAVPNKEVFESAATRAYPNAPFSVQIDTADAYGNAITPIATAAYSATGSGVAVDDPDATITFTTLGDHTVSGIFNGFKISKVVDVVKDTATVSFPTTSVETGVDTLTVTVGAGPSGLAPTGTVTLHYGTHSLGTQALITGSGSSTQTFFLPAAGTYSFYATYSGDASYNAATGAKHTIIVTP